MDRRGEYGGNHPTNQNEQRGLQPEAGPKIPENRQRIVEANLETFSDEEWNRAQQLEKPRDDVYGTLDAAMQMETASLDAPPADPMFWKVMNGSLETLGISREYITKNFGKMEGLMEDAAQNGPRVLGENKDYIDSAVSALNGALTALRNHERQLKSTGNPTSTSWELMQHHHRVEKDKMAAEKLRRGGSGKRESVQPIAPESSLEEPVIPNADTTVVDLQTYREERQQPKGFTFPDVIQNKRDPNYWKHMARTIAENPSLKGVAKSIETLVRRVERGDSDSVLDGEIQRITEDIDRRTAA